MGPFHVVMGPFSPVRPPVGGFGSDMCRHWKQTIAQRHTFSIHFHHQHQCIYTSIIIVQWDCLHKHPICWSDNKQQVMSIKSQITCWQSAALDLVRSESLGFEFTTWLGTKPTWKSTKSSPHDSTCFRDFSATCTVTMIIVKACGIHSLRSLVISVVATGRSFRTLVL